MLPTRSGKGKKGKIEAVLGVTPWLVQNYTRIPLGSHAPNPLGKREKGKK
jgi:hypothetical protein